MKGWYEDMMNNKVTDNYADTLDVRDAVYGVVTRNCSKGVFSELENGQQAFSYFVGLACVGAKCFVL